MFRHKTTTKTNINDNGCNVIKSTIKQFTMNDDDLILLYMCMKRAVPKKHSRYRHDYYKQLSAVKRKLRDRRIPRVSLQNPKQSAWRMLIGSQNNQSLITLTGLDLSTFSWLEKKFSPVFNSYSPMVSPDGSIVPLTNKCRPRLIDGLDCLGLILAWTRTKGSTMTLQILFGMTATCVSVYLRFGRRILIEVLKVEKEAAICLPNRQQIQQYKAAINERHPNLKDVWCTMDGLKLRLQQAPNLKIQGMYYNGWTHDHYVTAVLCFAPDGTIPICCYNVPGSIHDSKVAEWGNIYDKLELMYDQHGVVCTADSAFASKTNKPFILKSSQQHPVEGADLADYRQQVAIFEEATSMRQSAEWGMRAVQSSFPRLKDRLLYETNGERRIIFKSIFLLYNLRARKVGINQIKNVYMTCLNQNANDYLQNNMNIYVTEEE